MILMNVPAVIPLVTGKHRNRALAAARHARAVQLDRTYGYVQPRLQRTGGTVHEG
jgi:hypothetical protein